MLKSSKGLKRATVIPIPNPLDPDALERIVTQLAFRECGKTQGESWGFVPPSDTGDWPILPHAGNAYLLTLRLDRRIPNKTRLSREWHQAIKKTEKEESRRLNKAERDGLREDVKAKLFAQTPPHEYTYQGIYDADRRLLVITESSSSNVDFFVDKFNRILQGFNQSIAYKASSQPAELEDTLTAWAYKPDVLPKEYKFELGSTIRLENQQCKAVLSNQECKSEEVRAHLNNQKTVQQISLTWDEKVDFTLSSKRVLSQMNFKSFISESLKAAQEETHEDIRAYQQTTFMIFLNAFYELWDAVNTIPTEL